MNLLGSIIAIMLAKSKGGKMNYIDALKEILRY